MERGKSTAWQPGGHFAWAYAWAVYRHP